MTPYGEMMSKVVMALLCSSSLLTLCNFWIGTFLRSKQRSCQLNLCVALFSTLYPVTSLHCSGTTGYLSVAEFALSDHLKPIPFVPGVAIVIPKGAIPEGVKQEIYFKVCQDNNILPPLDKEKGIRTRVLFIFSFIVNLVPYEL